MSQDNKKSMVMYQGDGSNNVFAVPMTKGKYGTISVAFVRRGLDNYEYNPTTWTLNDENTLLTWTGDVLNVGDYIVIERTTVRKQPYEFPNNQKHIERSDDNLERQIQEVADAADRALKLDPTYSIDSDKMNPIEWLQTIVRCKDLTVRGLRFANNVLQYSKDDPEKPESEKTWYSLLDTDGITNVRERYDVGTDTYYFEYSTDGGSNWKDVGEMIRHNGLQGRDEADCHPISAITGLQDKLDEKLNTESAEETYATKTELSSHTENTDNPHNVTKAQVGLGNVDNTSDLNKPISTATQNALNGKLSIKQNPQDAGKVVKVGSDGNLELSSESSGGGLLSVSHGATLKGAGTDSQPLDVADGAIGNTQLAEEVKDEIAGKQPAGDYATNAALTQGLASKQDKLGFATATTAGIVRVGDGSQMVVNPTTGDISLDGTKASGIRSTIGALASNQGSSNSGLILGIDGSGNVVPTKSSSGGRNIGDIFLSARTNTGTAVNGAVLCNGARYNFSDINQGQNNIQALLNNGSIQSFSMAEYNAAVNSRLYVTPTFVSNSTDGHVVSDARGNSDIYTVFNGVDSKPIGNWSTYWIQEMFPANVFINSYSITADSKVEVEYPSTWELQGSNNGSSWDSLDLQMNLEFFLGETKTFPVYLSKSYKYYRLLFIDGAQTASGNGELGRVHFNVRQSSSIGYFGYDSGASYFKVPNLMDDNAAVMLSPSDFETFYHDAFFAGPQSLFLQSTAIPRALSTEILKPYVQLFNGVTDDAVATCTQALQQIANIQQTLDGMDYPIYWDSGDAADHSHAKPGVATPASGTWYRLYKSGWVEQGGRVSNPNNGCKLVTLPIAMSNTSFTALASGNTSGVAANYNGVTCERKSTIQIAICTTGQQSNGCSWRVEGYAGGGEFIRVQSH